MYNKGIRKIGQRNRSDAMIRGNVVFAFFTAHHLLQSLITWPVEQIQRLFPIIATNDLSFENTAEAYKSKSNFEIVRALLVFNLCSIRPLVDHNKENLQVRLAEINKTIIAILGDVKFLKYTVAILAFGILALQATVFFIISLTFRS